MRLPFTMPYGWAKRPSFQISVIWRWSSNYLHIKKRAQQQLMFRGCVTFWSKNNSAIYIFKKQKFGKKQQRIYFCSILTTKRMIAGRQISTSVQTHIPHTLCGDRKVRTKQPNYRTLLTRRWCWADIPHLATRGDWRRRCWFCDIKEFF